MNRPYHGPTAHELAPFYRRVAAKKLELQVAQRNLEREWRAIYAATTCDHCGAPLGEPCTGGEPHVPRLEQHDQVRARGRAA